MDLSADANTSMILEGEGFLLEVLPERGGGIGRLEWNGVPVLRGACGPSPLDLASFPLVPFSNRIANGRFSFTGREVLIAPNMPSVDAANPLHGFGWLSAWAAVPCADGQIAIEHVHQHSDWPWHYRARQTFAVSPAGLTMRLALLNADDTPMPAGLGFHPYFPREAGTLYRGLHRTEWLVNDNGLPIGRQDEPAAQDWWHRQPIASRVVDTVYEGREGDLEIVQPERGIRITMRPSANLGCTVVYTPADADFFCVEPVSHSTDPLNCPAARHAMHILQPGEDMVAEVLFSVSAL